MFCCMFQNFGVSQRCSTKDFVVTVVVVGVPWIVVVCAFSFPPVSPDFPVLCVCVRKSFLYSGSSTAVRIVGTVLWCVAG